MSKLRSLTDEILDLIAAHAEGLALKDVAARLGEQLGYVRASAEALDGQRQAVLIARGRGGALHLAPIPFARPVCPVCRREFVRKKKSKRVTCSRPCAMSYGWRDPDAAARRIASIKAERATPKARARQVANNKKRWSDPAQKERLREQTRKRWADPVKKAEISAAIRNAQRAPEVRALFSAIRKAHWDDPKKREKMIAGIKRSKCSKEARALFSQLLRERWADPVLRAKYTAANAARNTESREKNRARMKARWKDPVFVAKMTAWMKDPAAKRAASQKAYVTRRRNSQEPTR